MYEIFDTAIGFVLDYYSKGEKSKSCLCTYRKYLMNYRYQLQRPQIPQESLIGASRA